MDGPESGTALADAEVPRRSRLREPAVMWLGAALVVVLVAWGSAVGLGALLRSSGCAQPVTVRVAAAPAIAEAIGQISRAVKPDGCYQIEVLSRDSSAMADALANPPADPLPDAWIPESTFWLRRARTLGAFQAPDTGTSVASTPVVLAVTEPEAAQLGWPAKQISWSALLGPNAANTVPVGMPDPASDPIGVSALMAIRGLSSSSAADVAALRKVSPYAVTRAADLYQKLPQAGATGDTINAFVSSEQSLVRYNAHTGGTPLVAAYPNQSVPTLDFPYVVLPGSTGAARTGATKFLSALVGPSAPAALGALGFRGPDGRVLPGILPDAGARDQTMAPIALPEDNDMLSLLNTWTGVHLAAELMGVIDISGSMADPLPNGTDTKLSAVLKAALQGASLLMDSTEVSVWEFATQLDGNKDYRVIRPYQPLGNGGRAALVQQLSEVHVKPNGNTALYDTVYAAYQAARKAWTPGRINVMLVATDGKNDDPAGGLTRAQLLSKLHAMQDPRRPLPILFMGLSGGIDVNELQAIAGATGGKVYVTKDPSGIRQIFFDALADMACQPPACRR